MIEEMRLRDLGVIAEATLPIGAGFTAITGETGAGKTMVVEALGLLCGAKPDPGRVRPGAAESVVEGLFVTEHNGTTQVGPAPGTASVGDGNADIAGEKLTDDEFGFFVMMLAVAGNETTRNSITHGMIAFSQNPEQWELF